MPDEPADRRDGSDEERDDDDPVDVPIGEGGDESSSPDDGAGIDGTDDEDRTDHRAHDTHRGDDDRDDATVDVATPGTESDAGDPDAPGEGADGERDHWLSSLLSALGSLDDGSTSGRRRSDRTVVDYDISIGTADERAGDARFEGPDTGSAGADRDDDRSDRGRGRKRRMRSTPSSDHHLAIRQYEDELLVTADVADTDPDEVTVGFDEATLVVGVSGSELGRTEVPWDERDADATISNGVLSVRVHPATDATGLGERAGGTEDDDE